jgi:hypothetical protein
MRVASIDSPKIFGGPMRNTGFTPDKPTRNAHASRPISRGKSPRHPVKTRINNHCSDSRFKKIHNTMRTITLALISLLPAAGASALTINATFVDNGSDTWTAERRGVVNQAISEWSSTFTNNQTIAVTFDFTHAGNSAYLAQWNGSFSAFPGADLYAWSPEVTHTVHFNADYFTGTNQTWFDPTPADGNAGQPFNYYDALSITRHELGHMLGFTKGFYWDNYNMGQTDKWSSLISSHVFNPGGLNVSMADDDSHINQSLAMLMSPALSNSIRRGISATEISMLAMAYGYTVVPEPAEWSAGIAAGILGVAVFRRKRLRRA